MLNKIFSLTLLMFGLVACQPDGSAPQWHGKDITGLMPALQFELRNADNNPVTPADLPDKVNLLFFGFTNCPDICPTTLAKLASARQSLPEQQQQQVQILFVSVDPERDSGTRLRQYSEAFGDGILGLTGSQQQLQDLTRRYRVTYGYDDEPDAQGNYAVSHSSAVFAFDANQQVRLLLRDDLSVGQLADDMAALIEAG